MPRRNRNAATPPASTDALAAQARELASELHDGPLAVLCAACFLNPATTGDYCALCKGLIILSARRTTMTRR